MLTFFPFYFPLYFTLLISVHTLSLPSLKARLICSTVHSFSDALTFTVASCRGWFYARPAAVTRVPLALLFSCSESEEAQNTYTNIHNLEGKITLPQKRHRWAVGSLDGPLLRLPPAFFFFNFKKCIYIYFKIWLCQS